jgi:sugar (pentulose or hexulose) kinase
MAMGAIKDINEGRQVVKNSFDIATYEPQDSEAWDAAYEKWKEIIKKA